MSRQQTKYSSYDEVPFYRKQWFFWLTYVIPFLTIIALVLLVAGDIFYAKKGEVRSFGMANRVVAGIVGLLWLGNMARFIAGA